MDNIKRLIYEYGSVLCFLLEFEVTAEEKKGEIMEYYKELEGKLK